MGFYDVYGNVWEWCEDHFNGLPGFKSIYLYDDFTSPCFDGRHTILLVSAINKGHTTKLYHVCIVIPYNNYSMSSCGCNRMFWCNDAVQLYSITYDGGIYCLFGPGFDLQKE